MKIHELLSDPKKWCQGEYFRDANNNPTSFGKAYSRCILGGNEYVNQSWENYEHARIKLEKFLKNKFPNNPVKQSIPGFNDTSTHEEVIKVLKEVDI